MLSERNIAELLSSMLPQGRLNQNYESDSELIRIGGSLCLFTTDEFSAEDLFRENDPYTMGWNIAAGAISDILACGGVPQYYAHALTVGPRWNAEYLSQFGAGVRDVLNATGARFIGGDSGRSSLWRCTASVIGTCEGFALSRRGAAAGDSIYLSGRIGAGNLEAALTLQSDRPIPGTETIKNQFALRIKESALMKRYASAAIDTSDGVCSALNALADLNQCGYRVQNLPYLEVGQHVCSLAGLPPALLFLGGCGEYELLFTINPALESAFLTAVQSAGCSFYRLGSITPSGRELVTNDLVLDLASLDNQARDYESPQQYLAMLIEWLKQQDKRRTL